MSEMPKLNSKRFLTEAGHRIMVQVPEADCKRIQAAVLAQDTLKYGDYDQVVFTTSEGTQMFRSLPAGRNPATRAQVEVPCVELVFFTVAQEEQLVRIVEAIYGAHPYEEPVIQIVPASRTRHVRGMDEDNPNRFWNRPDTEWVPVEHRKGT